MASYIRVDDGDTHRLDRAIDPAEVTARIALALEGGDSVSVGIEFPGYQDRTAVLVVGRNASCVLVTRDEGE